MRALCRFGVAAVGVGMFVLDVSLRHEQSRDLVATLCPDDADWLAFLLDPQGAFLPADPWIEDAA